MLVDVTCRSNRLFQGVYQSRWWNFELEFRSQRYDRELDYPEFPNDFNCYGVCDSPEQLISKLPKEVTEGPEKYVISMVKISKEHQPSWGGWRWHKWGEYIGEQSSQCEYLYDEPVIKEVWTFHIYKV